MASRLLKTKPVAAFHHEARGGALKRVLGPLDLVLLAEAEIPYDALIEMDSINPDMPQMDVCLVVGANDVVNPAARSQKGSPIYGMPIIEADKAKLVIAIKRSMKPGFAGIDNALYTADNTLMVFGDAKQVLDEIAGALREEAKAAA